MTWAAVVVLAVLLANTLASPAFENAAVADTSTSSSVSSARGRRGSCLAAGLCCQTKNNTCRGAPSRDDVEEDLNVVETQRIVTPCFCDAACVDIGDCCDDYASSCLREYQP